MNSKWILAGASILTLTQCAYFFGNSGRETKTPKELYAECMSTFSDDSKCKEFVLKSIPDADPNLLGEQAPSSEEGQKLLIRANLIKSLQTQNKLYVRNLLGNPDEEKTINNWSPGMEEWVYYRPISKFAEGSRPDKEIRIRFQRGAVLKVLYTPPDPIR
ncbi:hypothetical protein ACE5IS_03810 [Leptospira wolffii]|uniref:Lipoprotein n=1 Tax=Leptospira wolffii TaxID=409998 RepID=A0ABV5BKX5_9LEPT|nr:hypothetical protein [Leptospira wolffii]TGL46453.1 hypothetical protein EHQ61_17030 [Leptospira wolffii]